MPLSWIKSFLKRIWKIIQHLKARLIGLVSFVIKSPMHAYRLFLTEQKRELNELLAGDESIGTFTHDSWRLFKDAFIPHAGNDHKPKALRPHSLAAYAIISLVLKVAVTGYLFLSYPAPAQLSAIVASRMVALANAARASEGVAPLQLQPNLEASAAIKGQDMFARQYFAHDTPEGKRPWDWINRQDYDFVYAGENLAIDFSDAEMVQAAFMKSPSHRRNIVNPKYKDIGVSVLRGTMNGRSTILLVEFFGTRRPTVAATAKKPAVIARTQSPVGQAATVVSGSNGTVAGVSTDESVSPEPINEQVVYVDATKGSSGLRASIVAYSQTLFVAFFIFLAFAFLLNVFVKIRVQHLPMILQTAAVMALLAGLIIIQPHYLQQLGTQFRIL